MEEDLNLAELQPNKSYHSRLIVRISRKWPETDTLKDNVLGMNIIFVDAGHKRMHAWVPSTLLYDLDQKLVLGNAVEIQNFDTESYTGKKRCFESDIHIVLSEITLITPIDSKYCLIPEHVFHFTNLENITSAHLDDSYFVDVVGIIDHIKPFGRVTTPRNDEHWYIDLVLTNTITDVKVRLWDKFAIKFHNAYNQAAEHPVIMILSCCQLKRNDFSGISTVRSVSATEFYLNANVKRVYNLRKMFLQVNDIS